MRIKIVVLLMCACLGIPTFMTGCGAGATGGSGNEAVTTEEPFTPLDVQDEEENTLSENEVDGLN